MLKGWKRRHYKFTDKRTSKRGVASMILFLAALVLLTLGIRRSFLAHGSGDYLVGVAGMAAFLMVTAGMILGLNSLKDEEVFHGFCWAGSVGNAVLWFLILVMIMIGI